MKKKFLQVFSLLMVIALMVITANAVVTDKPGITTSGAKVTLYGKDQTVQLTLTLPVCYGIEGYWSATATGKENSIVLGEVTIYAPHATVNGGEIAWADVYGEDPSLWLQNPIQGEKVTATYSIPAGTPAGSYMVTFTCTMFAGLDENNKITVTESDSEYVYTAMITVEQHACSDVTTDQDHICDDENCKKPYGDHSYTSVVTKPTCTATGYTTYTCNCGHTYTGNEVEAIAHKNKVHHARVEANCKEPGVIEYWSCPDCGKDFSDVDCKTVATDLTISIDPAKHKETEVTYANNGDTHSATYDCCGAAYVTDEEHTYDQDGDKCVCGAEKPVTNVAVTAKGTINYTVEGNVVTVTHTQACKVGYWDATAGKYIAIAAVANDDGSYSFTAPEGVTEVLLVAKGDVNGDGKCNVLDRAKIAKNTLKNTHDKYEALVELWMVFAGDIDNNGTVNVLDRAKVAKHTLKNTHDKYEALTW